MAGWVKNAQPAVANGYLKKAIETYLAGFEQDRRG
jgi:hypothetical protein